ncbi:transcription factor atf21 [Diaporthe eres]|nr:transcription factor atf21 [Diaporthe eres]
MAKRPGEPNVKVEAQPPSGYSSYFDCDTTSVAPTDQDLAEFDNLIDPSIFENNGNTDAPLQNNTRPIEAATIPGVPLASATGSRGGSKSITDAGSWDARAAHSSLVATEKAESERHQELSTTFRSLQDEVLALKSELLQHGNCNDHIVQGYLNKTARQLAIDSLATAGSEAGNASSVANSGPVHLSL